MSVRQTKKKNIRSEGEATIQGQKALGSESIGLLAARVFLVLRCLNTIGFYQYEGFKDIVINSAGFESLKSDEGFFDRIIDQGERKGYLRRLTDSSNQIIAKEQLSNHWEKLSKIATNDNSLDLDLAQNKFPFIPNLLAKALQQTRNYEGNILPFHTPLKNQESYCLLCIIQKLKWREHELPNCAKLAEAAKVSLDCINELIKEVKNQYLAVFNYVGDEKGIHLTHAPISTLRSTAIILELIEDCSKNGIFIEKELIEIISTNRRFLRIFDEEKKDEERKDEEDSKFWVHLGDPETFIKIRVQWWYKEVGYLINDRAKPDCVQLTGRYYKEKDNGYLDNLLRENSLAVISAIAKPLRDYEKAKKISRYKIEEDGNLDLLTSDEVELLFAFQILGREYQKKPLTVEELSEILGIGKEGIKHLVDRICKRSPNTNEPIIREVEGGKANGYILNYNSVVTDSITARILIDLRDHCKETSFNFVKEEDFKSEIFNAYSILLDEDRPFWGLLKDAQYLSSTGDYVRTTDRVEREFSYLERIAIKLPKEVVAKWADSKNTVATVEIDEKVLANERGLILAAINKAVLLGQPPTLERMAELLEMDEKELSDRIAPILKRDEEYKDKQYLQIFRQEKIRDKNCYFLNRFVLVTHPETAEILQMLEDTFEQNVGTTKKAYRDLWVNQKDLQKDFEKLFSENFPVDGKIPEYSLFALSDYKIKKVEAVINWAIDAAYLKRDEKNLDYISLEERYYNEARNYLEFIASKGDATKYKKDIGFLADKIRKKIARDKVQTLYFDKIKAKTRKVKIDKKNVTVRGSIVEIQNEELVKVIKESEDIEEVVLILEAAKARKKSLLEEQPDLIEDIASKQYYQKKVRKNAFYWYEQYRNGDKLVQKYIGSTDKLPKDVDPTKLHYHPESRR